MERITTLSLISTATAITLWMTMTSVVSAGSQIPIQVREVEDSQYEGLESAADKSIMTAQALDNFTPQLMTSQRAITVVGLGQATAPADIARLEFRFASRQPFTPSALGPLRLPVQQARQVTEEALEPVVEALVAIEIPENNIEIQTSSIENPRVLVTLSRPDRDRIQQVVASASGAVGNNETLFLQSIGAAYALNDCRPLERTARRAALSDAQNQANGLATDLGVQIGDLLFVTAFPISSPSRSFSNCGSKVSDSSVPFPGVDEAAPPYDPSAPVEAQVRSQVSITYKIQETE